MQRLTEETRFDDASRQQIIALAAELQRLEEQGASMAEIEAQAQEAGIDPKYVRMALQHVSEPTATVAIPLTSPKAPWYQSRELTLVSVVGFSIAQVVTIASVMLTQGGTIPFVHLFALAMGVVFSRTTAHRLGAIAILFGSTLATVLLTLLVVALHLTGYPLNREWPLIVGAVVISDLMMITVGFVGAAFGRWLRNSIRKPNA